MLQSNTQQMSYFSPTNPSIFPANFGLMQSNLPALELSKFLTDFPNYETSLPHQELTPNSSCISNNSTSDEAEDHQFNVLDQRKQRRMISNRESARRSRMRKQRHLDELWSQVLRLRTENHSLIEKLNEASESHDTLLQENVKLKKEAADLHKKLMDLTNSYSIFTELEDLACDNSESSNQSATTPSQNLLY